MLDLNKIVVVYMCKIYGVLVGVFDIWVIKFCKGYLNNYNINNFFGSFVEEDIRELLEKKLKDMKG